MRPTESISRSRGVRPITSSPRIGPGNASRYRGGGIQANYDSDIALGSHLELINSNYGFCGDIEFSSIYERALSASEVAQLYREPFCMLFPYSAKTYFLVGYVAGGTVYQELLLDVSVNASVADTDNHSMVESGNVSVNASSHNPKKVPNGSSASSVEFFIKLKTISKVRFKPEIACSKVLSWFNALNFK